MGKIKGHESNNSMIETKGNRSWKGERGGRGEGRWWELEIIKGTKER